jgi:hypothetical protein
VGISPAPGARHPELVSGSIVPHARRFTAANRQGRWRHDLPNIIDGWTLKRVQGDELVSEYEKPAPVQNARPARLPAKKEGGNGAARED